MKRLLSRKSSKQQQSSQLPARFDSVHPDVYHDAAFSSSPPPEHPLHSASHSLIINPLDPDPSKLSFVRVNDEAPLHLQPVDPSVAPIPVQNHKQTKRQSRSRNPPYPSSQTNHDGSHRANVTRDLDRIDELDESSPIGLSLHHGGPYEAVGRMAPNGQPNRMPVAHMNGGPYQTPTSSGPVLNLSPGQILPRNTSIFKNQLPSGPPPSVQPQVQRSPPVHRNATPLNYSTASLPTAASIPPPTRSETPRTGPTASEPRSVPPRHSMENGDRVTAAHSANENAASTNHPRAAAPEKSSEPPPYETLLTPVGSDSLSVYDPADAYGGIEDESSTSDSTSLSRRVSQHIRYAASSGQASSSDSSIERTTPFQATLHAVPETLQPGRPSHQTKGNMMQNPLPGNHPNGSFQQIPPPRSSFEQGSPPFPQPTLYNQSNSSLGSRPSVGPSRGTTPANSGYDASVSSLSTSNYDRRAYNPHMPKRLVMPTPLQQQVPQQQYPLHSREESLLPRLPNGLPHQPVLHPDMSRSQVTVPRTRTSLPPPPPPSAMQRAQEIPIASENVSRRVLKKRASVAYAPSGSGKHASVPPNVPLDFSADIGLRNKHPMVPSRSASERKPAGKPPKRLLSKRRNEL